MKNTHSIYNNRFDETVADNMSRLERIVGVCQGCPKGDELPQVANQDETIIELLHDVTGIPVEEIDATIRHNYS